MRLGFGATGPWAMKMTPETRARAVLTAALESGIAHLDTAGFYAGGRAERRLARLLGELDVATERLEITTKIGKRIDDGRRVVRDFSPETTDRLLDRHAELFGRAPDIVYLHGPDLDEAKAALPHLIAARDTGRLGRIGVCSDGDLTEALVGLDGVEAVMARYNFADTRHAGAFRAARTKGGRVVAIAPLAQGLWRRDFLRPSDASGAWYLLRALVRNRAELRAVRRAGWLHEIPGWDPVSLCLAFVRQNPDIDTVLTTSTRPANIRRTATAFAREVPANVAARLGDGTPAD